MSKATLDLKDPAVAAVLGWLIPGFGHFYQGRMFKAVLYFVCIVGTFSYGMYLGDGKVTNWEWSASGRTWGYLAQVAVGLPALPALVQSYRVGSSNSDFDRVGMQLDKPLVGEYRGHLKGQLPDGKEFKVSVLGQIELVPAPKGDFRGVTGQFTGQIRNSDNELPDVPDHAKVELTLNSLRYLEPPIFPSPDRKVECEVRGTVDGDQNTELRGDLYGEVVGVRTLVDRFEAPLDDVGIQDANGDLGKYFELGLVYTWIAGLLNVLSIWDAFEGPAYGYGDEDVHSHSAGGATEILADSPPPQNKSADAANGDKSPSRVASVGGRAPPRDAPASAPSALNGPSCPDRRTPSSQRKLSFIGRR